MRLGSYSSVSASASLKGGQRLVVRGRKNESKDRAFRHRGIVSRRQKSYMAGKLENVGAGLDQNLLSFGLERGPTQCMRPSTFVQALFSPRMVSIACELGGCHA